jgi:hypothetical protein
MNRVAVTEAAAGQLYTILMENRADERSTLRLVPQPGGRLAIALSVQDPSDETIEAAGETVLVLEPRVAALLDGSVLDIFESEEGPVLAIRR